MLFQKLLLRISDNYQENISAGTSLWVNDFAKISQHSQKKNKKKHLCWSHLLIKLQT